MTIKKLPEKRYTIEIANQGNSPVTFPPTKTKLYARWDYANCLNRTIGSAGHKALAMEFRDGIPGMCVQLDLATFTGRIFWPQSLDGEGEEIKKRMAAVYKAHPVELGKPPTFDPPAEFKLDADGMKAWLYNMRRIVDQKLGKFVAGSDEDLPSLAEVKGLPGKLPRDPFFEGRQDGTGEVGDDRPQRWKDDVRVPKDYEFDHEAAEMEAADVGDESALAGAGAGSGDPSN